MTGTPSGFESGDGNMVLDNLDGSHTDWNCFAGGGGFQTGTPDPKCKVTTGATQVWADGGTTSVGSNEFQFKSGTKFDDACVTINTGNNPPKDEWSNIAEYTEASTATNSDGGHDLYFYGASIRPVVNGNSSGNVYFNQKNTGCHTVGDVLLTFDFLQGGGSPTLHSLRWIASGTCFVSQDSAPCWGNQQTINNAALFDGNINTAAITAANNKISGTALPINAFAEFGINLTQAVKAGGGGSLPCFANENWVSRSSGSSFTSNPEDVETVNKPTCGTITIIKHTLDKTGTRSGVDKSFGYTTTGGLTPSTFNLNDKDGTDTVSGNPDPNNTQVYSNVPAGSYTVTEGSVAGFTFKSLTCSAQGNGTTASQNGSTTEADIALGFGGSAVCTYVNQQNSATIATQQSTATGTVFPGTSVTDTATVTGSNTSLNPSGTVSFFLCGPLASASGCTSSDSTNVAAGTGTLSNPNPPTGISTATSSPAVNTAAHPLGAGIYCFEATWPGDTNYPGALDATTATNECFTVSQISTTVVTTPSPGQNGSTTFGDTTVTDSALITAAQAGGGAITGSVTFFICNPTQLTSGTCSSGGTQVGSPVTNLVDGGTDPATATAVSAAFTNSGNGVNKTGTWCWRAVFTPTGNNYTGNSDSSATECFTVTDSTSSTSEQDWLPNDTAHVGAAHGAPLNGTLSAQLYTGDNCGVTSGSAVNGQLYTKTLAGATSAADRTLITSNTTFKVTASSSVSWLVTFTSTDNNVTGSSHCEKSTLTITN